MSKELLEDVLRYYFDFDSGYLPVNMIDEINQIYDISGKNKLVFEIPDFWDIADTGNVEYIRKLLEKSGALLLFPVRCEARRLKLYDNIVKGNFEKAYFDRKNRYIVVGDSNVELPEQYNEIYGSFGSLDCRPGFLRFSRTDGKYLPDHRLSVQLF